MNRALEKRLQRLEKNRPDRFTAWLKSLSDDELFDQTAHCEIQHELVKCLDISDPENKTVLAKLAEPLSPWSCNNKTYSDMSDAELLARVEILDKQFQDSLSLADRAKYEALKDKWRNFYLSSAGIDKTIRKQ